MLRKPNRMNTYVKKKKEENIYTYLYSKNNNDKLLHIRTHTYIKYVGIY